VKLANRRWLQRSYDPLDYLLVMRILMEHNLPLEEAIYPAKFVGALAHKDLKRSTDLQHRLFGDAKLAAKLSF